MIEEVLTWLGVIGAAGFAWALYTFGESETKRCLPRAEEQPGEE